MLFHSLTYFICYTLIGSFSQTSWVTFNPASSPWMAPASVGFMYSSLPLKKTPHLSHRGNLSSSWKTDHTLVLISRYSLHLDNFFFFFQLTQEGKYTFTCPWTHQMLHKYNTLAVLSQKVTYWPSIFDYNTCIAYNISWIQLLQQSPIQPVTLIQWHTTTCCSSLSQVLSQKCYISPTLCHVVGPVASKISIR